MPNTVDSIVVFGGARAEQRRVSVAPDHLISGKPEHMVRNYYLGENGQYRAGIWQSTAGKWHAFSGRNEFCHMLEGRVRLSDRNGNSKTFVAGDSFVIPPAFDGTWEVLEDARKLYVIFEPDDIK